MFIIEVKGGVGLDYIISRGVSYIQEGGLNIRDLSEYNYQTIYDHYRHHKSKHDGRTVVLDYITH